MAKGRLQTSFLENGSILRHILRPCLRLSLSYSFCLSLCLSLSLTSQVPPDYKLMGVSDGLSHRDIKYATRDSRGFLWVMNSGIDFYDGQKFTSYNKFDPEHFIPVSSIRAGCKLQDSLLVFTEAKDLYSLNMLTGHVRPMAYPKGMNTDFNDLVSIIDRQHHPNLLMFTRTGAGTTIHVIDRNWNYLFNYVVSNTTPLHLRILRSYANGPDGVLWLLDQASFQILRIDASGIQAIPFNFEHKDRINFRFVYLDGFGLVICRNDGLIYALREGTRDVVPLMEINFTHIEFNPSHVSRDGWIWSLSEDRMVRFNPITGISELFDIRPFGSYSPVLRSSFEDEEGITWISSEVGLLEVQPKPKPFLPLLVRENAKRNFQFRDILPASASSVFCRVFDEQTYLMEMHIDAEMKMDTAIRLSNIPKTGMFRRHGEYLYHVESGRDNLIRYSLAGFKEEIIRLPVRATTQYNNLFLTDAQGMIFYQDIHNCLTGFHPETFEQKTIVLGGKNPQLKSVWKDLQYSGQDKILIGTETAGLLIYDRNSGALVREFSTESPRPLSGNFVNVILQESDSILWVGTIGAGVNRINIHTGEVRIFTTLDGLANNLVASMLKDDAGNIWIGTYGGLSMYSPADGQFYNYYTGDGLSDNEFNYLSALATAEGRMYMGTLNGITVFDPKQIFGSTPLPPLQITRIQKYNRRKDQVILEDKSIDPNRIIEISPYDNYIQLDFAVPSYKTNNSHLFFSKLSEVDADWQNLGRNAYIRYQKLPPGRYQLELMAVDGNGNRTIHPTMVRLHVQQLFYMSVWFLSLLALGMLASVFAFYRYRLRLVKKEHATRTRIASDLHDEVGGTLTGLSLQLQMMELQAPSDQKSHLNKVSSIINESITKMRDLVWSIDARSDHWGNVLERMKDYAADTLFPKDIAFQLHHDGISPEMYIDARMKHNLYLIYKEAIHNASKHSRASAVEVRLWMHDDQLSLQVSDNGVSYEQQSRIKGQGMQNMVMRAERLKGQLRTEHTENGFTVRLEIPY